METSKIEQLEKQLADHKIKLAAFEAELQKAKEHPKEKNYTWEECFSGNGFIAAGNTMVEQKGLSASSYNCNVATTEKVCKSHLAACMLSHIIEAINKDYSGDREICLIYDKTGGKLIFSEIYAWELPYVNTYKGMDILCEYHEILLEQFFGIE